jgi:hypothetical protein
VQRVVAAEVLAGEDVVDQRHGGRVLVVVGGEPAAAQRLDAQGVEVLGLDRVVQRSAELVIVHRTRSIVAPELDLVVVDHRQRAQDMETVSTPGTAAIWAST